MTFDFPIIAMLAGALAAIALFCLRRVERLTLYLIGIGCGLLAVASGGIHIHWHRPAVVVAMIDQSASTRTATFHDADEVTKRIRQLVPDQIVRQVPFSDPSAASTNWQPADAEAILLFSDGQFELPSKMPPTWAVVDPALMHCRDAAVESITQSSDGSAFAIIRNDGESCTARCGDAETSIPTGGRAAAFSNVAGVTDVHLNAADAWPENDALPVPPLINVPLHHWWLGENPPAGWEAASLPATLTPFCQAAVIATDGSLSASPAQISLLKQYVSELGGGLILVNPARLKNTALDELSPLASDAPTPASRWIFLIDGSGSMSQRESTQTRFEAACAAARTIIGQLPRNDVVAIGGFARNLTWWLRNVSAVDAQHASFPPTDFFPNGPTNLEPLLLKLLQTADANLQTRLVVITDSDAALNDANVLQAAMIRQQVSLNVLSINSANESLARVAAQTGGKVLAMGGALEIDSISQTLVRGFSPTTPRSVPVTFADALHLPPRDAVATHPAWLREHALSLADTDGTLAAAAEWQRGDGRVVATAFAPSDAELSALADRVAREPVDPRIELRIEPQRLVIDAGNLPNCNHRNFSLTVDRSSATPFVQTAPGRYAAPLPPSEISRVVTVQLDGAVIRRIVVSGRYPPEFDSIGINRATLQQIAAKSGGGVIEPDDLKPIALPQMRREVALAPPLAALGAATFLLAALRRKL